MIFVNDGIKTTQLDMAKSTIVINPEYHGDFDHCVTLIRDFINQTYHQQDFCVADVNNSGGGSASKGVGGSYYTK